MSTDPGLESLYREVILDHYKNPRGHGLLDEPDAQAEGQNPLCGDEVTVSLKFAEDGETIVKWALKRDKKSRAGAIRFVLLRALGDAYLAEDVSESEIAAAIDDRR